MSEDAPPQTVTATGPHVRVTEANASPADADLTRLALLHARCLPTSVFSLLGQQALEGYYRFVATSPAERLLVAREGLTVVGAAVLSEASAGLSSRLLRSRPRRLAAPLVRATLFSGAFRRRLLAHLSPGPGEPTIVSGLAEVVQIFVHPDARGRGVGGLLLDHVEAALNATGRQRYYVKTDDHADAQPAHRFYGRRGFTVVGRARFAGAPFVYLVRDLTTPGTTA